MLYFFTEKEKKSVKKEYYIRLFTISLSFLIIILFLWIVALIPTYFYLNLESKALNKEMDSLTLLNLSQDRDALKDEIQSVKFKLSLLKEKNFLLSDLIKEVTDRQVRSVNISTIVFKKNAENQLLIELQGVSNNRESLVEFGNLLKKSERFESVDLPVSSFTRSSDIPFLLTIIVRENKNE